MRKTMMAAAAATFAAAGVAQADTYDLQSTFGLNVPSIGPSPQIWADRVARMTDGEVQINVHGAGDFVPPFEVFGAVSSGALPMGFDWIGYWAQQIPVANLVGSMPFGPTPEVALGWMFEGGGLEIIQKAYDPFNVKVLPCHLVLPEAGGWFNKEINAVEDLQGLNMRIAGLGGLAMAKLGANTQLVPAGEIFLSLETGRIDAAEFSAPQLDVGFGFQRVTDYYYFPGWHQPSSWDSIIINMDVWNSFDEETQTIMEDACKANIAYNLHDQVDAQADAIAEIREAGVEVKRFPDEVLAALREASDEVMNEQAQNDPIFAEALSSLREYMDTVGEWGTLQDLPAR
ncbi:TRAP transporter substrate-binding protein [Tranquillimonas alkanivorans]|uniref:TRAP-type mannitol/chloroaromatic compound transport system, substrate-binding protein n=1 Tax=Tranquillimonas alkanivorans TaxID=441119 RepID=A0A1I5UIZ9_9RHOB|nr:TRAP transporter substrate-binding protein [Tranquillimonas alkanivorans]SFP95188.1 TRAP-type mannitol/chloroaromatic compound transport system, substrate-binding protein [Tranquillimonas alkanivorans]